MSIVSATMSIIVQRSNNVHIPFEIMDYIGNLIKEHAKRNFEDDKHRGLYVCSYEKDSHGESVQLFGLLSLLSREMRNLYYPMLLECVVKFSTTAPFSMALSDESMLKLISNYTVKEILGPCTRKTMNRRVVNHIIRKGRAWKAKDCTYEQLIMTYHSPVYQTKVFGVLSPQPGLLPEVFENRAGAFKMFSELMIESESRKLYNFKHLLGKTQHPYQIQLAEMGVISSAKDATWLLDNVHANNVILPSRALEICLRDAKLLKWRSVNEQCVPWTMNPLRYCEDLESVKLLLPHFHHKHLLHQAESIKAISTLITALKELKELDIKLPVKISMHGAKAPLLECLLKVSVGQKFRKSNPLSLFNRFNKTMYEKDSLGKAPFFYRQPGSKYNELFLKYAGELCTVDGVLYRGFFADKDGVPVKYGSYAVSYSIIQKVED